MSAPAGHVPRTASRSTPPAARHTHGPATARPAHPPGVAAVLALQRGAGNRAVAALLHGPIVVQRGKGTVLVWSGGGVIAVQDDDPLLTTRYTQSFDDGSGVVRYSPDDPYPPAVTAPPPTPALVPGPGAHVGPPPTTGPPPQLPTLGPAPTSGYQPGLVPRDQPRPSVGEQQVLPPRLGPPTVAPAPSPPAWAWKGRPTPIGGLSAAVVRHYDQTFEHPVVGTVAFSAQYPPPAYLLPSAHEPAPSDQFDDTGPADLPERLPTGLDPVTYAGQKLAGQGSEHDLAARLVLIRTTPRIVLHRDRSTITGLPGHTHVNEGSDFVGGVFHHASEGVLRVVNLAGDSAYEQTRTYLRVLGAEGRITTSRGRLDARQPVLAGIGHLRWYRDGPVGLSILPLSLVHPVLLEHRKRLKVLAQDLRFVAFVVDGSVQLAVEIAWANADLAGVLLDVLHERGVPLSAVNLHGICGSLDEKLGPGALVRPQGKVYPERGGAPLELRNRSTVEAAAEVAHGHVENVLHETPAQVEEFLRLGVRTVEMEAYHVLRRLHQRGFTGTVRMVFSVIDVVTSDKQNLTEASKSVKNDTTLKAKQDRNRLVLEDFALIPKKR